MTATDNGQATGSKIRVDMMALTLREQKEINRILHNELGCSFTDALQDWRQPDALALAAWMFARREDPTYTREQAEDLDYYDMDMVGADVPGGLKAATATGGELLSSPATGP